MKPKTASLFSFACAVLLVAAACLVSYCSTPAGDDDTIQGDGK